MSQNTNPIFTLVPNVGNAVWTSAATANTKSDGTGTIGTDMKIVFTAGVNGSFVQKIRACPTAIVAATATTPTVLRVYFSIVGAGTSSNSQSFQIAEMALPAQTADQTATATTPVEIPLGMAMESGSFIHVSMHHAAAANTAWQFSAFGGDY